MQVINLRGKSFRSYPSSNPHETFFHYDQNVDLRFDTDDGLALFDN